MAPGRRIRLRRTGGLVAARALETELDLAGGDADAHAIAGLLERVDVARVAGTAARGGPGADTFQYEITIEAGGRTHRIVAGQQALAPELRPIVERLERRALAEARERRERGRE